jgi:hypothetical protein
LIKLIKNISTISTHLNKILKIRSFKKTIFKHIVSHNLNNKSLIHKNKNKNLPHLLQRYQNSFKKKNSLQLILRNFSLKMIQIMIN